MALYNNVLPMPAARAQTPLEAGFQINIMFLPLNVEMLFRCLEQVASTG